MSITATWRGRKIASSANTILLEGNHYFDPADVDFNLLIASDTITHCPWKGAASYLSICVDDEINTDAAWYYPDPKAEALAIKDRIAFWRGVEIEQA